MYEMLSIIVTIVIMIMRCYWGQGPKLTLNKCTKVLFQRPLPPALHSLPSLSLMCIIWCYLKVVTSYGGSSSRHSH